MLTRVYQFAGVFLLSFYAMSSFYGWEFGSGVQLTPAPPANADIVAGSGLTSRSGTYRSSYYSSSRTRSGWGGGGFGGK